MKHYTKEWQGLLSQMDVSQGLRVIEDKEYSDQDVLDYIQALEDERVIEDREVFDTMPNLDFEINLINEMYDSSEISLEEKDMYLNQVKRQYDQDMMDYLGRGEFDEELSRQYFREDYNLMLDAVDEFYPSFVLDAVRVEFLALFTVPKSVYKELQKRDAELEEQMELLNHKAGEELAAQDIPMELYESFDFHDAIVVDAFVDDPDFIMLMHTDDQEDVKVIFKDAKIIEDELEYEDDVYFIYRELYRLENNNYEVHMMLSEGEDYRYLTIECSDVVIDKEETA
ncbi:MAG: hypothetical protein GXY98_01780 [Erysipelothrix sp.]|nr:hypothetical protein [Erysipelothrix sp.]